MNLWELLRALHMSTILDVSWLNAISTLLPWLGRDRGSDYIEVHLDFPKAVTQCQQLKPFLMEPSFNIV